MLIPQPRTVLRDEIGSRTPSNLFLPTREVVAQITAPCMLRQNLSL